MKSTEGTTHAVIVSTVAEAWGLINGGLIADGTVKDVLYGLPIALTKLDDLSAVKTELEKHGAVLRLMIDHEAQVKGLEEYMGTKGVKGWNGFIKVDAGNHRAGLVPSAPSLPSLIKTIIASPALDLYGFYCHAGHSYSSTSLEAASAKLKEELDAANEACTLALSLSPTPPPVPYAISVGSTPTAHAASLNPQSFDLKGKLEIHAGNYPFLDLQQLATTLVGNERIAATVLTTVISSYPDRDGGEGMCDAGALAMSKDRGPIPGFGDVVTPGWENWRLGRISQEHGVFTRVEGKTGKELVVGSMLQVVGQHSCLTSACFPWYYIVDSSEGDGKTVVDVWVPWRAW
ncbi:hypothetical protein CALCODRAFT_504766 [Calocera cornea HHB12733]|uniref:D-serine dehydratase-like domain-containing protein n=1 Tax=Calocera cornea HHB12733 TaxID=1353952 RepID=A0A165C8P4_9BASI|nr:hypothetical protein CALCODRAFT_504766 [Calocera cornea HHB12733]